MKRNINITYICNGEQSCFKTNLNCYYNSKDGWCTHTKDIEYSNNYNTQPDNKILDDFRKFEKHDYEEEVYYIERNNFPVITLCGSSRFKNEFIQIQKQLISEGNIVLSIDSFSHYDGVTLNDFEILKLDQMHKQKIDMADGIMVIDVDGYIGKSTTSEINYAKEKNKTVLYMSKYLKGE